MKGREAAPLIIGGCPSSGTTLLRSIIDSHPDFSCGPELGIFDRAFIYREGYSHFRALIQMSDKLMNTSFVVKGNDKRKLNLLGEVLNICNEFPSATNFTLGENTNLFRYVKCRDDVVSASLESDSYEVFFDRIIGGWARRRGSRRWAEKSPENIYYAHKLLNVFPGYQFIHIVRSPLDVIASLINRSFHPMSLEIACERYVSAIKEHNRCVENENYLQIWYEDIVYDFECVLKNIMSFLNENIYKEQLSFFDHHIPSSAGYASTPVYAGSIDRWQNELDEGQLSEICGIFEREGLVYRGALPSSYELTDTNRCLLLGKSVS